MFCRDVERNKIGDYNIPKHVTDQNTLEIQIEYMKKMDAEQQQTKTPNVISILKLSFLQLKESIKYLNSIIYL